MSYEKPKKKTKLINDFFKSRNEISATVPDDIKQSSISSVAATSEYLSFEHPNEDVSTSALSDQDKQDQPEVKQAESLKKNDIAVVFVSGQRPLNLVNELTDLVKKKKLYKSLDAWRRVQVP